MAAIQIDRQDLELKTQRLGLELIRQSPGESAYKRSTWLDRMFVTLMRDEAFRVQALRFVDVMPTLTSDAELVRHFREYFGPHASPLPQVLQWGLNRADRKLSSFLLAPTIRHAVRTLGRRFIAGETAQEALRVAAKLRGQGINSSLDMLGEVTLSEAEAHDYEQRYLALIDEMRRQTAAWSAADSMDRPAGMPQPRVNLSVKVSALYSQIFALNTEGSIRAIGDRLRRIFRAAMANGACVILDMEQYDSKHIVLETFKQLLVESEFKHWPHVGIALQAYLRETVNDVEGLIDWVQGRGTPVTVRLVRGAYWDYETVVARQHGWPVPVWTEKAQTDASYEACLEHLLGAFPYIHTAVATHNVRSHAFAMALAARYGLSADDFEFQMLYGMATKLRDQIVARGYHVRVYLPFGALIPGMAYLVRRLLENSSSQSILRLLQICDESQDETILTAPRATLDNSPSIVATLSKIYAEGFKNEPLHRFTDPRERERFGRAVAEARAQLNQEYVLAIPTQAQRTFITSCNPANPTEIVGCVQAADQHAVDNAIEHATIALPSWATLSMDQRADYLVAAAQLLRVRRDEFAAWEMLEAGKNWGEADANVVETIDFLEYYAAEARRVEQPFAPQVAGEMNELVYQPRGVAVILPPWNFPLAILTGMLSAAIVCGNTAILKPSSETPVLAARVCALLAEAGIPEGVVTLCPGSGAVIGKALVGDPRTHIIAFTGSREVGLGINRLAAESTGEAAHVKRVVAEMGGKNAIIVDSDADWDDAIAGIVTSAFGYQGQKCSACSRVIFVGSHYEAFVKRLVEAARSLTIGDPTEPQNFMGPVISSVAKARILKAIEEGKSYARLVLQVDCSQLGDGYFIGPTIFADVPPESKLAQEEIFGPVLAVMRAKDFGQALMLANGTRYALTGGLYSRSPANLARARREFQVGNLYLNRKISGAVVGRQPFGGFKLSGMGQQAGGPHYLMQFLQTRTVTENTLRRGFAPTCKTKV
jgi:RHH-type transcriptional regulator, proline utilization regulon repressor / proline dehydrogenase / delta 1-pyrroline-5-carboxylate dehydrogenase